MKTRNFLSPLVALAWLALAAMLLCSPAALHAAIPNHNPSPGSLSIDGSYPQELLGSSHRKIALNGRPLSDEKPQAEEETDEAKEESYIDALTMQLTHSTTDIYIPVPTSTDLALSVRRNSVPEAITYRHMLIPVNKRPDRPFGSGWSSNIGAHVKIETTSSVSPSSCSFERYVYVTDHNGQSHRFILAYYYGDKDDDDWDPHGGVAGQITTSGFAARIFPPSDPDPNDGIEVKTIFRPLPSGRHELDTLQSSLRFDENNDLIFTMKYGTQLKFEATDRRHYNRYLIYGSSQEDGAIGWTAKSAVFFRLVEAKDRFGNTLNFSFPSMDEQTLIPSEIKINNSDTNKLTIASADGLLIDSITDPRQNTYTYSYEQHDFPLETGVEKETFPVTEMGGEGTSPTEADPNNPNLPDQNDEVEIPDYQTATLNGTYTMETEAVTPFTNPQRWYLIHTVPVLRQVTKPSVAAYSSGSATGPNTLNPVITYGYSLFKQGDPTPRDLRPYNRFGHRQAVPSYHVNLNVIKDANGNKYKFNYHVENSFYNLAINDEFKGYYLAGGLPRWVQRVQLPTLHSAKFRRYGRIYAARGSNRFMRTNSTLAGPTSRATAVEDAQGNVRVYNFGENEVLPMKEFKVENSPNSFRFPPTFLCYGAMTITHLEGGTLLPSSYEPELGDIDEISDGHAAVSTNDFGGTVLGSEIVRFNCKQALTISKVTDFSTNERTYEYGNLIVVDDAEEDINGIRGIGLFNAEGENFATYNPEPTKEINALGDEKLFEYDADKWWVMTQITDEEGRVTKYDLDALGQRTKETVGFGGAVAKVTDFSYGDGTFDAFMTSQTIQSLNGEPAITTTYVANSAGLVEKEYVDENGIGLLTEYEYDNNFNKTKVKVLDDASGQGTYKTTTFEYDNLNRLVKVTNPDSTFRTIHYDARGNKVAEVDENGHATLFEYDVLNRRVESARDMDGSLTINAGDLVTEYTYNKVNSKLSVTDPNGNKADHTYDALQRLVETETPSVKVNSGPSSRLVTTFDYDVTKNPGGTVFNVDGFKPTSTVDPRGFETRVTYDELYRAVETEVEYVVDGAFSLTKNFYDKVGNMVLTVDPLGQGTGTKYDAADRPTEVHFAVSHSGSSTWTTNATYGFTKTVYTASGTPKQVTDEEGRVTTNEYDAAGRLVMIKQPAVHDYDTNSSAVPITKITYDLSGNEIERENPLEEVWEYEYDLRNRKTKEIQPEVWDESAGQNVHPEVVTSYDDVGNVLTVTDPRGNVTTTVYDDANRAIYAISPQITLADGSTTHPGQVTAYDANGNVTSTSTAKFTTPASAPAVEREDVRNTYDALNRLTKTRQDPNGLDITVENEYDQAGNRTAVEDGKNQRTIFAYDGLNRLLTTTDPAGEAETIGYDALNKTSRTDAEGRVTQYDYDSRHRLEDVTYVGRTQDNRTYAYDKVGNILTVTEPGKNGETDVAYTYDTLYRISTETSQGITHRYRYDLAGNRRETIYDYQAPSPSTYQLLITATYDALNRTSTMTEGGRTTTYRYDAAGNIVEREMPNSETCLMTYDALNRAIVIDGRTDGGGAGSLYLYENFFDVFANLARVEEDQPSGLSDRVITNTYDGTNRLDVESINDGSTVETDYDYDDAHNRTRKVVTGGADPGTWDYSYNNLNQLTSWTGPNSTSASYTYDKVGNRQTHTRNSQTDTYSWDYDNRLVELDKDVTGPGLETGVYEYCYDYRTRRVIRDESGVSGRTRDEVVFSGGTSAREYEGIVPGAGAPAVEYVRGSDYGGGIGGILYTLRSGAPSFTHYNSRGDVVAKTDSTGALTYQAQYEAFGTRTAEAGNTEDRQKANTKDEDPTGLLNEGFRYRDLETGVFISRDPLGFVDGPNLYTYVVQNPWTKFDNEGLFWSLAITVGFAVYDTYQYASGQTSLSEYSQAMALNSAAALADVATGGNGGGLLVRAGNLAIKTAKTIDKANTTYETVKSGVSAVGNLAEGNLTGAAIDALSAGTPHASKALAGKGDDLAEVSQMNGKTTSMNRGSSASASATDPKGGTYKLTDPETGEVRRTGKTNDLNRRELEHARGEETRDLDFQVDKRTDDAAERTGREMVIHDQHPEAKHKDHVEGGTEKGLNKRRPVSPNNNNAEKYRQAEKRRAARDDKK